MLLALRLNLDRPLSLASAIIARIAESRLAAVREDREVAIAEQRVGAVRETRRGIIAERRIARHRRG